jgi:hypothetical protein
MKKVTLFATFIAAAFFMTACGGGQSNKEESKEETTQEDHANHEGHDMNEGNSDMLAVPAEAKVFFRNIQDGDEVSNPVNVEFGVEGMEVKAAGELVEGTGHHHIVIDGEFIPAGEVVPADSLNIHYGKGQTEAEIELPKGEHTLTMQFADGIHQSYGEQMSATVTVFVK